MVGLCVCAGRYSTSFGELITCIARTDAKPYKNLLIAQEKKISEYDQEISQSHTADQPAASRGRDTEQKQ